MTYRELKDVEISGAQYVSDNKALCSFHLMFCYDLLLARQTGRVHLDRDIGELMTTTKSIHWVHVDDDEILYQNSLSNLCT